MDQNSITIVQVLGFFWIAFIVLSIGGSVAYLFGWNPPPWMTQFSWHLYTPPRFLTGISLLLFLTLIAMATGAFGFSFFKDEDAFEGANIFSFFVGFAWAAVFARTVYLIGQAIRENSGELLRGAGAVALITSVLFAAAFYFRLPVFEFIDRLW